MTDERQTSSLKGRLANVFVPALVDGALDALSRRLGNRATIDDPVHGRASSLAAIDPLLAKASKYFAETKASYRQVSATTGVDRDLAEGVLTLRVDPADPRKEREATILVVAERRRLREIELRLYYALPTKNPSRPRPVFATGGRDVPMPQVVAHVVDALKKGAVERVLAAFEETSRIVDPSALPHGKRDGKMAAFVSELGGLDVAAGGSADDGRTCCVEATLARSGRDPTPAALCFERGDSGLLRELRVYWDA
jgi:hypothetical protein